MSDITFKIDGKEVTAKTGQTIMEAADDNGIYIPRLCTQKDLAPHGSCRVCTVKVNGRCQAACTQPAAKDAVVDNDTPDITEMRKQIVEMLFVEGNHFCPFCEKSGDCELQAMAYRLGVLQPRYPYQEPKRSVDASHADILIDRNRCILCGRCVRASRDLDGKTVFEFVGRGIDKRVQINAEARLKDTELDVSDKAVSVCPVGAILTKRQGFKTPYGQRAYDKQPIGSEIESKA
jgi:[NiFe] hydrogenase diaphorase moiety small subunit